MLNTLRLEKSSMETRVASYRFRAWPLYDAIPSAKSNSSGGCDSVEGTLIAESATFYGDSNAKCKTVSRSQPDFPRSDCGGNLVVFSILMDFDVLAIAFFYYGCIVSCLHRLWSIVFFTDKFPQIEEKYKMIEKYKTFIERFSETEKVEGRMINKWELEKSSID